LAKFTFRLQSVLNIKLRLEEQQKNAFSQAKKRLDEEEEKLRLLFGRLEEYEEEGRAMREKALHVRDILENEEALIRIKEYIEDQKAQVRLYERKLEEERLKLVELMKERKTYERLREKAFEEFLEEEKHEEAVANDEHNSYVYGKKDA